MSKNYYVYIITNKNKSTLYIGVTNDLARRMYEHKYNLIDGFSQRYSLHFLVYYEETEDILSAIKREKQLKKWKRAWKDELITNMNSVWKDLSDNFLENE